MDYMDMRLPGFEREVEVILDVMRRAGKILLDNYDNPRGVERKPDGSLKTEADDQSSRLISSTLAEEFPEYGVLDEQQGGTGLYKQRAWVIDPMDNTKGYVERTGDFSVIAGILDRFVPVFGALYRPLTEEFVCAAKGRGSYMLKDGITETISVSDSDGIHALVSRTRSNEELEAMLKQIEPDSVTRMGGSLKTVEIAKGTATLFLCPRTSKMSSWDICGPSVILEEVGGRITDVYGNPFGYGIGDQTNYNGIVASNGRRHDYILERISRVL
jgi:3'(2'), 5'-bisphosphate nucleotidase